MVARMLNVATQLIIASAPPIGLSNLTGNGLRIEWTVEKSRTPSPDHAEITVYNLGRVWRESLAQANKLPAPVIVSLAIGWDMVPELLFAGQAWKIIPERRVGNDVLSVVEAGEGSIAMRDQPPGGGSWVGIGAQLVVAKLLGELGWVPSVAALAQISEAGAALPIQKFQHVYDGNPREQLDEWMATLGLSWGVVGSRFMVYQNGVRRDQVRPVLLTPTTGLTSWAPRDDGAVEFEALAQPAVEPGYAVTITDPYGVVQGAPQLRVESITFSGSSEGPSMMAGLARRLQVY